MRENKRNHQDSQNHLRLRTILNSNNQNKKRVDQERVKARGKRNDNFS